MLSGVVHTNRKAVLDTLILTTVRTVYLKRIKAHDGCDRSTGMLTPPRHFITPLVYPEFLVCPILKVFPKRLKIDDCSLFMLFHVQVNRMKATTFRRIHLYKMEKGYLDVT
jgi:hypothetical protein